VFGKFFREIMVGDSIWRERESLRLITIFFDLKIILVSLHITL